MDRNDIVRRDKSHVWHPYTAMDRYLEDEDPFVIVRAEGSHLHDADGKRYIDGNSSWWVASLGHGHPRLLRVLREQSETLAHCSLAGSTHEPAARLAEELCAAAPPGLQHVFYTDNGSTAVEAAVKMAVQFWRQTGYPNKSRFIALDGAFHGDTVGAASLGGVEIFRRPFAGVLFDCVRAPFPGASPDPSPDDTVVPEKRVVGPAATSDTAYAHAFQAIAKLVDELGDTVAAVVVEPLVQGASGMRMYPAAYLRELHALCRRRDVLLIVDEVFTGYGRTGTMWACDQAGITPDILCLGKAFASLLPMGATLTTPRIFDGFRGPRENAFYYGHTFCGHPLGAALAREVLAIYRDERIVEGVGKRAAMIAASFARLSRPGGGGTRGRALGMIGAVDLVAPEPQVGGAPDKHGGYLGQLGWHVYREARRRGAYLRPLGDTVYVCPPLTIHVDDLADLLAIVEASVDAAIGKRFR